MKQLLLLFLVLSFDVAFSQDYVIDGRVVDSLQNPIQNAIVLLNTMDGHNVVSQICDSTGEFRIKRIVLGQYRLHVLHSSYDEYSSIIDVDRDITLSSIILFESVHTIKAVKVIASSVRYGFDNYTVSLQNNPVTKGKNALDVIGYLPHVKTLNGEITVLGQAAGTIRINGIIISDPKELEAISAENLENAEVILIGRHSTNARGGEINLKLKRTPERGFYGSVTGQTSAFLDYGHNNSTMSSSVSYGVKKLSIYNYFLLGGGKSYFDDRYATIYKRDDATKTAYAQTRTPQRLVSDRLSVNYDISDRHTIGANLRYSNDRSEPKYFSHSELNGIVSSAINNTEIVNNQYQTSLIYNWKLDDFGSSFRLSSDYLRYITDTERNHEYTFDDILQSRNKIGNQIDMFYLNTVFSVVAAQKHQLRFGLNYNSNRTSQTFNYQDFRDNAWADNDNWSGKYKLTGDDYSAFFAFSSKLGNKVTYGLSLRYRHFDMGYKSIGDNLENKKRFDNAEITANLNYQLNEDRGNMLYFAYERWYDRVPYSAISPIVTYIDEYSYTKGNLDLEPTVMDNLFLILTLRNSTEFNVRVQRVNNDGIKYETFVDETAPFVTYTMPVNGLPSYNARLTIDHTFEVAKWWKLNLFGLAEWRKYSEGRSWIGLATIQNDFTLPEDFGGKISFYGRTNSRLNERKFGPEGSISFLAYKYFLNRKLQLSVECTALNHSKWTVTDTNDLWMKHTPHTNMSRISLRLSYHFTGGKNVRVKRVDGIQSYNEIRDELLTQ